jgi:hypothetical protein
MNPEYMDEKNRSIIKQTEKNQKAHSQTIYETIKTARPTSM